MEHKTKKNTYRVVKRTYDNNQIKYLIQFKIIKFTDMKWTDLLFRYSTYDEANFTLQNIIPLQLQSEEVDNFKDEEI